MNGMNGINGVSGREAPRSTVAWSIVGASVLILVLVVGLPVAAVFVAALSDGLRPFVRAISSPDTRSALALTLLTLSIVVPCNTAFGLVAAWALTKSPSRAKGIVLALIDLPLAMSPVVAGLLLTLVFGARGILGPVLAELDARIVFAPPAVVLAATFVTLPFVAREVIPVMQALGNDDELSAVALGASGWQVFLRVTLPNVRWSVIYGALACAGRCIGEFGAVSVVSGHIRGETNTLSLHVEALHDEYDSVGAFSVAALLASFSFLALGARKLIESRVQRRRSMH